MPSAMYAWSKAIRCLYMVDVLYFDGNEQIARLRDNVCMENRNVTLFTDSLNYEMRPNIGYFFDGGSIVDERMN